MFKHAKRNVIITHDPFFSVGGGFGDGWLYCSYLLEYSLLYSNQIIIPDCSKPNNKTYLSIMKPLFDTKGDFQLHFPDKPFNIVDCLVTWDNLFVHKQLPTKQRWVFTKKPTICYQFDGKCESEFKNPPIEDVKNFISTCESLGYNPVNIGGNVKIDKILDTMVNSCMFVGCPSGMASMALSTGVPMNIVTYKLTPQRVDMLHKERYGSREDIKYFITLRDFTNQLEGKRIKL